MGIGPVNQAPQSVQFRVRGLGPALILLGTIWIAPCLAQEAVNKDRQAALVKLVRNDCGACHGMTLAGGLGSSLLPERVRSKSAEMLKETILHGRAGTAMPPWQAFISEEEADWIVEKLKEGFPSAH
jgi:cytochrome c55X